MLLQQLFDKYRCLKIQATTATDTEIIEHPLFGTDSSELDITGGIQQAIAEYGMEDIFVCLESFITIAMYDRASTLSVQNDVDENGYPVYRIHMEWSNGRRHAYTIEKKISFNIPQQPASVTDVRASQVYSRDTDSGPAISKYRELGKNFCDAHQVSAPYVAGAMAGGIASVEMVSAMAKQSMLAFFGAGGLSLVQVEDALQRLQSLSSENLPWGCNLLHNIQEPEIEERTVDLLLQYGVRFVSASAFTGVTASIVRYRFAGIREENGRIVCPNALFAKLSHPSVAEQFLSPPARAIVERLVAEGVFTKQQAEWAMRMPVATDISVEADSGGHTDRRPLVVIVPYMQRLRHRLSTQFQYPEHSVRIGAAGGLGDPHSINAAFALGADYVLLGSIHQTTVEANTSPLVKSMLAEASITDFAMGAAPDMFEQGAQVQVLSKGSMYAARSMKLYGLYRQHNSIEEIPATEIAKLEKQIFQQSIADVWKETATYWQRDPKQLLRAEQSPKHKMALIFRWYLGQSSRWARQGVVERQRDFQIWSGPSLGLCNQWIQETELADLSKRHIVALVHRLLDGVVALQNSRNGSPQ